MLIIVMSYFLTMCIVFYKILELNIKNCSLNLIKA